jgi:hypothetical protein
MVGLLETMLVFIYRVSQATFKDHPTYSMLSYMIFTRVSYWLKIWGSKSSSAINLIKDPTSKLHVYAVLIQDVKDMIEQSSIIVYHTLKEENQSADFFARLGAFSDSDLLLSCLSYI